MRSRILGSVLTLVSLVTIAVPGANAHERQSFTINGKEYLFVVGSLNEPLIVDDKSGVDLRVKYADPVDPTNSNAAGAKPVIGLEKTLQVEISAGDAKKTQTISPAYNDPGAYKTTFIPTVATSFSYRFFGTIDGTPVNLIFSCKPEGKVAAPNDTTSVPSGDKITRTFKAGAFGCPLTKASYGFPEEAPTLVSLATPSQNSSPALGIASLAIALLALARTYRKNN